jgi:hypothetical protein
MWDNLRLEENRPLMHENIERWFQLCALAAEEQDSDTLAAITREIHQLLEQELSRANRLVEQETVESKATTG